jgi:hypothetical protein
VKNIRNKNPYDSSRLLRTTAAIGDEKILVSKIAVIGDEKIPVSETGVGMMGTDLDTVSRKLFRCVNSG